MSGTATAFVRDYTPADLQPLVGLVRELQAHEHRLFDRMKPPEAIGGWYVDRLLSQCRDTDGHILVVECDGRIAGYATVLCRVHQDDPDEQPYEYAEIGDLAVASSHRGKGFGGQLIAACEERARAAGARWLRISVLVKNHRARALYEASGFDPHLVEMEKPLT